MTIRIDLQVADEYRRKTYGVLFESITTHDVVGPGVHNRHHPHRLDVWRNRDGKDPNDHATVEPYSYLLSAKAVVISASPQRRPPEGDALSIGDRVELFVHDYSLGVFVVQALPLHDPHLVPLEVFEEAERQRAIAERYPRCPDCGLTQGYNGHRYGPCGR